MLPLPAFATRRVAGCCAELPTASSILLRVGTAIIGGLLAILGAAAGSALTYLLQRKIAVGAEEFAVAERVRPSVWPHSARSPSLIWKPAALRLTGGYQRHDAGRDSDAYRTAKDEGHFGAGRPLGKPCFVHSLSLTAMSSTAAPMSCSTESAACTRHRPRMIWIKRQTNGATESAYYVEAARLRIDAAAGRTAGSFKAR